MDQTETDGQFTHGSVCVCMCAQVVEYLLQVRSIMFSFLSCLNACHRRSISSAVWFNIIIILLCQIQCLICTSKNQSVCKYVNTPVTKYLNTAKKDA